jgi:uncharacterized membrane protein (UPF0127 family)
MKKVSIVRANGSRLCNADVADSLWTRGVGLLTRSSLGPAEGLLIEPCTSVHTFFMRFPIDVLYLDQDNVVVKKVRMSPFRFSFGGSRAKRVLEVRDTTVATHGIQLGERLTISPG